MLADAAAGRRHRRCASGVGGGGEADAVLRVYQLCDGLLPMGIMATGGGTRREAAARPVRRGRETGCLWCGSHRFLFLRSVPVAPSPCPRQATADAHSSGGI
jgi:hypothetical protein